MCGSLSARPRPHGLSLFEDDDFDVVFGSSRPKPGPHAMSGSLSARPRPWESNSRPHGLSLHGPSTSMLFEDDDFDVFGSSRPKPGPHAMSGSLSARPRPWESNSRPHGLSLHCPSTSMLSLHGPSASMCGSRPWESSLRPPTTSSMSSLYGPSMSIPGRRPWESSRPDYLSSRPSSSLFDSRPTRPCRFSYGHEPLSYSRIHAQGILF